MKTSEFTATDSITLKAELAEIYKQARKEKMYITNRAISENFCITWKDMMLSYDYNAVCLDRIYKPSHIKEEERDIWDTSSKLIPIMENIQALQKEISEKNPEELSDEEKIYYQENFERLNKIIENTPPELKKIKMPLYINSVTEQEWPVMSLESFSDEQIAELTDILADYALHTKAFLFFREQSAELKVALLDCGEWFDLFVI